LFRFHRARAIAAAAVLGAATLGALSSVGTASAAVSKITCTRLKGSITTSITLSGCSGNTGGSSTPLDSAVLATGGTITWVNGKTTTVTMTVGHTETDPTETRSCPATSSEFESRGTVTADTTGSAPVGGVAKSEECYNGVLSFEPGTALKLK
jgi:hypothetical protein